MKIFKEEYFSWQEDSRPDDKKCLSKKSSDTGTRTLVSCVKGKYANHLHHIGSLANVRECIK